MSVNTCTAVVLYNAPKTTAEFVKSEAQKFQMMYYGMHLDGLTMSDMEKMAKKREQSLLHPKATGSP